MIADSDSIMNRIAITPLQTSVGDSAELLTIYALPFFLIDLFSPFKTFSLL